MSLRSSNKSSLFLIELVVVILFFSIAAATCVSLFVRARLTSLESSRLTMAVNRCQNAAEAVRAVGDDPDALAGLLSAKGENGQYLVRYDKDGLPSGDGRFLLTISLERSVERPGLLTASISLADTQGEGEVLYSLETARFTGQPPMSGEGEEEP